MILVFGSRKGGVGKTTTAVNVCVDLVKRGKDVILVDADKTANSTSWASYRDMLDGGVYPHITCIQKFDNIKKTVSDLNQRYEYVIVDASGKDSMELRSSSLVADIIILPLKPSQFDLITLPALSEIIDDAVVLNPNLKTYGLFTMCPTNPRMNELDESKEYFEPYENISLLKSYISERRVFRAIAESGLSVSESDNPKATKEISNLVKEVLL